MRCYYAVVCRLTKEDTRMSTIITAIDRHSPAERAGIQVGEQLLTINGHTIVDVLDYRFYGYDPLSHVELKTAAGQDSDHTQGGGAGSGAELRHVPDGRDAVLLQPLHLLLCGSDAAGDALHAVL